ncbi:hypothetical protein ATANTOWER_011146 [Ataeniobius toweri]|uniref:Uncharacterized protein n=1 Tax=Ataeniobius toweri TaxID=208326 RepID=A0ABU7CAA3_9TELE|nr:hypothetical protein [Ataeniobius toweri]
MGSSLLPPIPKLCRNVMITLWRTNSDTVIQFRSFLSGIAPQSLWLHGMVGYICGADGVGVKRTTTYGGYSPRSGRPRFESRTRQHLPNVSPSFLSAYCQKIK